MRLLSVSITVSSEVIPVVMMDGVTAIDICGGLSLSLLQLLVFFYINAFHCFLVLNVCFQVQLLAS